MEHGTINYIDKNFIEELFEIQKLWEEVYTTGLMKRMKALSTMGKSNLFFQLLVDATKDEKEFKEIFRHWEIVKNNYDSFNIPVELADSESERRDESDISEGYENISENVQ